MKQEFVTVYGKVIIEKDKLFIRSFEVPFSRTPFAQVGFEVSFLLVLVLQFFTSDGPGRYVGIIVWGLVLLVRLPNLYDVVFKRSYASRIALSKIKSVKTEEDTHGLETYVILNLHNGRYRKIIFRRLENQYESLVEAISQHTSQFQYV
jgi:hypothetical protein